MLAKLAKTESHVSCQHVQAGITLRIGAHRLLPAVLHFSLDMPGSKILQMAKGLRQTMSRSTLGLLQVSQLGHVKTKMQCMPAFCRDHQVSCSQKQAVPPDNAQRYLSTHAAVVCS